MTYINLNNSISIDKKNSLFNTLLKKSGILEKIDEIEKNTKHLILKIFNENLDKKYLENWEKGKRLHLYINKLIISYDDLDSVAYSHELHSYPKKDNPIYEPRIRQLPFTMKLDYSKCDELSIPRTVKNIKYDGLLSSYIDINKISRVDINSLKNLLYDRTVEEYNRKTFLLDYCLSTADYNRKFLHKIITYNQLKKLNSSWFDVLCKEFHFEIIEEMKIKNKDSVVDSNDIISEIRKTFLS